MVAGEFPMGVCRSGGLYVVGYYILTSKEIRNTFYGCIIEKTAKGGLLFSETINLEVRSIKLLSLMV